MYFIWVFYIFINFCKFTLCRGLGGVCHGTCVTIDKCPEVVRLLQTSRIRPQHCDFAGNIPIVCCPNSAKLQYSISQQKCTEYARITDAGAEHVLGGLDALPLEFPHMAILGYGDDYNIQWKCAGSLISEYFVLTAAHCIHSSEGKVKYVDLGRHDMRVHDPNTVQKFKVRYVYQYPSYSYLQKYNDIALILLDGPADIRPHRRVRPACLQTTKNIRNDAIPIVTGWGATVFTGSSVPILQKAYMTYVPYQTCRRTYPPARGMQVGLNDNTQICAKGKYGVADTCQGDSGGPIQIKSDNNLYTVVGITSFGIKCGIVPAVYTRVSNYVSWIEKIVWPKNSSEYILKSREKSQTPLPNPLYGQMLF